MRNSSSSPYGTRVSEQRYRTFEPFSGAWSRSWFDGAHHLFSISCACSEPVSAPDGYALGLLLCAVFNPTQPPSTTAKPPHPMPQVSSRSAIPSSIFPPSKNSSTRTLNHECHPRTYLTSKWQSPVEKDMDSLYIIDSSRFVLNWTD